MKKIASGLIVVGILVNGGMALAADWSQGSYTARTSVNVRAAASIYGKIISHLNPGQMVSVTGQKGLWCKVDMPRYANAYVKCDYLISAMGMPNLINAYIPLPVSGSTYSNTAEKMVVLPANTAMATGVSTTWGSSTVKSGGTASATGAQIYSSFGVSTNHVLAVEDMQNMNAWLTNNNDQGKNFINTNLDQANLLGAKWSSDAYLAKAEFNYPSETYCSFTLASAKMANMKYRLDCAKANGVATGISYDSSVKMTAVGNPELKLSGFVSQLLSNDDVLKQLDAMMVSEKLTRSKLNFVLAADNSGVPTWTMTITANNTVVKIASPADKAVATFKFM